MTTAAERNLIGESHQTRGVFTRRRGIQLGVTDHVFDRRIASGAWLSLQPGVCVVTGTPVSHRTRLAAALMAVSDADDRPRGRIAAVSHSSAAWAHGLQRAADADRLEITVTGRALPILVGVEVHRSVRLDRCDVRGRDGLATTTPARTAIDMAPRMSRHQALALVDDVIGMQRGGTSWVHRRAVDLAKGRRNVAYLARMTHPDAAGEFRSWLERAGSQVFRQGGLPRPRWNVSIYRDARLLGVVDALFDPAPVIAELDGPRFHDSPGQQRRDRARDRQLQIPGYAVLHFSYLEIVHEPALVISQLADALSAHRPALSR
jgi:hypothetical protein